MSEKIKQAITDLGETLRGGGAMSVSKLSERSGIGGKMLTDALCRMEELGMVRSLMVSGVVMYRWAVGKAAAAPETDGLPGIRVVPVSPACEAAAVPKTDGLAEPEQNTAPKAEPKPAEFKPEAIKGLTPSLYQEVAAYFRARPNRVVRSDEIHQVFAGSGSVKDVLRRLKHQGLIDNPVRGQWVLIPEQPLLVANAEDQPYWRQEVNIGGFADGTFEIRKGAATMRFSREQMLAVTGFVDRFLAMEV